jgi:heme/copper-type cytochrome/quinol oxidase subunit 2
MEQQDDLFDLHLDQQSVNYLHEASRWSRLLSIVGFIYCGLMVIFGLFFGSMVTRMMSMSGMGGTDAALTGVSTVFLSFFITLMALIFFFPAYFLFNFSSKMRRALHNNDQASLTDSIKNLKSFFKFYGIIVIIFLSIYGLALISAIIGAMVGSHRP